MAPFFHDLSILSLNGNVCWWPEVGTVMCWSHWNRYTFTTDLRLDIPPPLSGDSHRSNIASHCSRIWGYMWPLTSGVLLYTVIGANHWAQQATTTHQKKNSHSRGFQFRSEICGNSMKWSAELAPLLNKCACIQFMTESQFLRLHPL
jgi:hypothetical protein